MIQLAFFDVSSDSGETLAYFEASAAPAIGAEVRISEGPEAPDRYRVVSHRWDISGNRLRSVWVGLATVAQI